MSRVQEKRVTRAQLEAGVSLPMGRRMLLTLIGEPVESDDAPFVHLVLKDPLGNLKAGAQVQVLHGGAVVATGRSDANGVVRIEGLPPADGYQIEVVGHRSEKKS